MLLLERFTAWLEFGSAPSPPRRRRRHGTGEAGFLVGTFLASMVKTRLGLGNTLAASALVIGLTGLPIAFAPTHLAAPIIAAGLFAYGLAAVVWTMNASGFRQAITPNRMLGRVGSVMRVAAWAPSRSPP